MGVAKDSIYKKAVAAFTRQRKQAQTLAKGAIDQNWADYRQSMKPFSQENLTTGQRSITGDAAGRGMLTSTTTGKSLADFLTQWNEQKSGITRQRERSNWNTIGSRDVAYGNIKDQEQQAVEDLIARNNARKLRG